MSDGAAETARRNYIFVCGAPRSGTTAITQLLNFHPNIVIGIERYKNVKRADLCEQLFTAERFFDFRQSDTNVLFPGTYLKLREKYRDATWIGDKWPRYYTRYEELFEKFEDCVVIFMLRDVHAVASSWNKRAENPADRWPESNDYTRAVEEWNLSLKRTLEFKRKYKNRLLIVEYEQLFSGDIVIFKRILHRLNLAMPKPLLRRFRGITRNWDERSRKPLAQREGQTDFVNAHADMQSCAKLRRLALRGKARETVGV